MTQLTEFQQRALIVGLQKLFERKWFDICTFDNLLKVAGLSCWAGGKDYNALRLMHCVNWADMGPQTAAQVRDKVMEMLRLQPIHQLASTQVAAGGFDGNQQLKKLAAAVAARGSGA